MKEETKKLKKHIEQKHLFKSDAYKFCEVTQITFKKYLKTDFAGAKEYIKKRIKYLNEKLNTYNYRHGEWEFRPIRCTYKVKFNIKGVNETKIKGTLSKHSNGFLYFCSDDMDFEVKCTIKEVEPI